MGYLERYLTGEYEQVWNELQALGPAVREQPNYSEAWEVAVETMRRVRRNCERLVTKLGAMGYVFGTYPDGSRGYYSEGPLVPPSAATHADVADLEKQVGHIPLSLAAFLAGGRQRGLRRHEFLVAARVGPARRLSSRWGDL